MAIKVFIQTIQMLVLHLGKGKEMYCLNMCFCDCVEYFERKRERERKKDMTLYVSCIIFVSRVGRKEKTEQNVKNTVLLYYIRMMNK